MSLVTNLTAERDAARAELAAALEQITAITAERDAAVSERDAVRIELTQAAQTATQAIDAHAATLAELNAQIATANTERDAAVARAEDAERRLADPAYHQAASQGTAPVDDAGGEPGNLNDTGAKIEHYHKLCKSDPRAASEYLLANF